MSSGYGNERRGISICRARTKKYGRKKRASRRPAVPSTYTIHPTTAALSTLSHHRHPQPIPCRDASCEIPQYRRNFHRRWLGAGGLGEHRISEFGGKVWRTVESLRHSGAVIGCAGHRESPPCFRIRHGVLKIISSCPGASGAGGLGRLSGLNGLRSDVGETHLPKCCFEDCTLSENLDELIESFGTLLDRIFFEEGSADANSLLKILGSIIFYPPKIFVFI
jgi:hypothetical protein